MKLGVGIIGLPNVGKSTLFNALLKKQQALIANYPFATIEPNIGMVPVPDFRLASLANITKEEHKTSKLPPIKPATVNFVDIAGLVKGAAGGAGLGNKFLSHIREVDVIVHVVRAFVDENVIREGSSDPESDYAAIQTELVLADLSTAEHYQAKTKSPGEKKLLSRIIENLDLGIPIKEMKFSREEKDIIHGLFFLSAKPELIVLNVNEDDYSPERVGPLIKRYKDMLQVPEEKFIVICAKIEAELSTLTESEQKEFLAGIGFKNSGLERLIQKAYQDLGLISFLTAGEKEVKAWTVKEGSTALEASAEIHTDFIKKFIKAEVVSFENFVKQGGWRTSREKGKTRLEGKDYLVKDGDVIEFKIGS